MFKAISIAIITEAVLVVLYMFASRSVSTISLNADVVNVYLQYEMIFFFNLLESIVPSWFLGTLGGFRGIPVAVVFRFVTLLATAFLLGSADFFSYLAGRPISLHLTYLFCAFAVAYVASKHSKTGSSQAA